MRPVRLRMEGFSSYRRPADLDFADLDLFAITGRIGAGKSSILDGITYALYGRVPRLVGAREKVRPLINLGSSELRVELEFTVGADRYRVMRETTRIGRSEVRLERFDDRLKRWLAEEGRKRNVDARVRDLLGLDFDGFTRSVLLPQGRFQEFLSGGREERRSVLSDLLQLDLYKAVMRKASVQRERYRQQAIAKEASIAGRSDATPERLEELQKELLGLLSRKDLLLEKEQWTKEAVNLARTLDQSNAAAFGHTERLEDLRRRHHDVAKTLPELENERLALDGRLEDLSKEIGAIGYDAESERCLDLAVVYVQQVETVGSDISRRRVRREAQADQLKKLSAKMKVSEEALSVSEEELALKETAYHEAMHREMAAELRQVLSVGDNCPVCRQTVLEVPSTEWPTHVGEALRERNLARQAAEKAAKELAERRKDSALVHQEVALLDQELDQLEEKRQNSIDELLTVLPTDTPQDRLQIETKLREQRDKRGQRAAALERLSQLKIDREKLAQRHAVTEMEAVRLQRDIDPVEAELIQEDERSASISAKLLSLAESEEWIDVVTGIMDRIEVAPLLWSRLEQAEAELPALSEKIGALGAVVDRMKRDMSQVETIRQEVEELRSAEALAGRLAELLEANKFQQWLMERALKILALDGSRHWRELSDDQYEFRARGQEFIVVDHWNADEERSVETLSAGETFLASLALAMALAEGLPGLGASSRQRTTLESLFLDEGFGSLDEETQDTVVSALESVAHQGGRMVGLITHLTLVAERMPVCIKVVKSESGSEIVKAERAAS